MNICKGSAERVKCCTKNDASSRTSSDCFFDVKACKDIDSGFQLSAKAYDHGWDTADETERLERLHIDADDLHDPVSHCIGFFHWLD